MSDSSSRAKLALILCLFISNAAFLQVGLILGQTPSENSMDMRDLPKILVTATLFSNNFTLYNDTWNYWSTNESAVDGENLFICAIGLMLEWDGNRTRLNTTHSIDWYPWNKFNLSLDRVVIYGSIDEEKYIDEYGNERTDRHSVHVDSLTNETTSLLTDDSVFVVFWGRGSIYSYLHALAFAIHIEIDGAKVPLQLEVQE